MLEVFTRLIGFLILNITSIYIIKKITNSQTNLIKIKNLIIILISIITQSYLYKNNFSINYSLLVFILNIISYKLIFKLSYIKVIISTILYMFIIFICDICISLAFMTFVNLDTLRTDVYIKLISSTVLCLLNILIIYNNTIIKLIRKFYIHLCENENIIKLTSFCSSIVILMIIINNIAQNYEYLYENISSIILVIFFTFLITSIIKEKVSNVDLIEEYDNLFTYIQNFEEWIEKDQLNRHEYKNQLSVLRLMAKSKQLKAKIDEILDDTIDINNEVINELSTLPKGGIKGLMYYKAAVAQKQKINLTVNVSLQENTYLNHLTTEQLKDMNKLIGIYFDNAIEAARETKKKIILAEIYEFDSKVKFVISNTFKKSSNIENKHQKGKSTKGIGRGNGLYFASKIIKKYKRVEEKQEVIDDYYIQSITLNKRKDLIPKS